MSHVLSLQHPMKIYNSSWSTWNAPNKQRRWLTASAISPKSNRTNTSCHKTFFFSPICSSHTIQGLPLWHKHYLQYIPHLLILTFTSWTIVARCTSVHFLHSIHFHTFHLILASISIFVHIFLLIPAVTFIFVFLSIPLPALLLLLCVIVMHLKTQVLVCVRILGNKTSFW